MAVSTLPRVGRVTAATVRDRWLRLGPWPPGRTLRGASALVVAVVTVSWTVRVEPVAAGLLAVPGVAGLLLLAAALGAGRTTWLGPAVTLLGVGAGAAVLAGGISAPSAAGVGAGLVGVMELGRWSIERRVALPGTHRGEWRRWVHLCIVLGGGWILGVTTVVVAGGRVELALWQPALGAAAVIAVMAAVVAVARARAAAVSGDWHDSP